MDRVRVFTSFDLVHDHDLKQRLLEESLKTDSGFEILGCSEPGELTDLQNERVRRRIDDADQVIFLCGAHTDDSMQVGVEISIAQKEQKPYFLLWGRREVMCTRPIGARPGDSMYSWTSSIVRDQIAIKLRMMHTREAPAG